MRLHASTLIVITAGLLTAASFQSPERFFRTNLGTLDATAPIPYFIEDGSGLPGARTGDRDLVENALAAWSRESGGRLRFVAATDREAALVRVIWNTQEGLFGQTARVQFGGRPGAVVYVTPDLGGLGPELARGTAEDPLLRDAVVYLTAVHELGHALGLPHTADFEDIMYSFGYGGDLVEYFLRYRRRLETRGDIREHSGLSPNDRAMLGRLYGRD